ncbi:MAG: hypothetical protein LBG65_07855 [Puniceicoccales bacterium]|jgi:hypothetical protein|nr:hypothetical protein [Puniceicoccales bacterium]
MNKPIVFIFGAFFLPTLIPLFAGNAGARISSEEIKAIQTSPGPVMTPEMMFAIPGLWNNLRPVQTISFDVVHERFGEDGVWFPIYKRRVRWDFEKERLYQDTIEMEKGKTRDFFRRESLCANGKRYELRYYVNTCDLAPVSFDRRRGMEGSITKADIGSFSTSVSAFIWFFYIEPPASKDVWPIRCISMDSIFQPPGAMAPFRVVKNEKTGETNVLYENKIHFIDTKTGVVNRHLMVETLPDGRKSEDFSHEVLKFHKVDGRLFPVEIICYDKGKPCYREHIDPDSLKIDREFAPADLRLRIPAGTMINDAVKGSFYRAGREITPEDAKEIENDLRNLVERARNDTGMKKNAETKK